MGRYDDFLRQVNEGIDNKISSFDGDIVRIDVNALIDKLRNKYGIKSKFLYDYEISFSLTYSDDSDVDEKNIKKIKNHFSKSLPYLKDFSCHTDDKRIVFKFLNPGEPIKFEFNH